MLKTIFTFISLFCSLLADSQTDGKKAAEEENGTVFFLRSTGFYGSVTTFSVFVDEILVCRLENNSYTGMLIAPGKHKFSVQLSGKKIKDKTEKIEIKIEEGKKYYVQVILEAGAFKTLLYCRELTEASAKETFKRLRPTESCD